jgi:saccharopine dehydrogenase-like NADP-dependent oxidoreductase
MKSNNILIVGGYGTVGQVISRTLCELFPHQVIVAGRNYQKAKEFASVLNQRVTPMQLDINSISKDDAWLDNIHLVIMCIDQRNTEFVKQCIQKGVHYIDITANYDFLSKIELLDSDAKKYNSTVVLSVGLAPGLTNLLAKQCWSVVQNIQFIDIFIMLGLGEKHGDAAYRWAFEDLNDNFLIRENGKNKRVGSFEDGKQTIFPDHLGKKTAYRSNFSDQHVIPRTLDINSVSTRICFDSAPMTWIYAILRKTGLSNLLKLKYIQDLLIKSLKLFRFGTDKFMLKVESGREQKQTPLYQCSLGGNGQGRNTGLVAAKVAQELITSSFPSGVFQIEQLFEPIKFFDSLSHSLKFQEEYLVNFEKM